ncbi:M23 family metallopeptidase [Agromyces sp. LHK192]|uniref:M23 family metallopeptidase n=1 Tax=Agromyces sp. LHK192 TaxID=2498704 RepID=UPI000FD6D4D9|nr:M23 family metallopeptidase [Agromyces sp. LHK192]
MVESSARAASLVRVPALRIGFLLILLGIVGSVVDAFVPGLAALGRVDAVLLIGGLALTVVGMVLGFWSPLDRGEPLIVDSPVSGRWQAVNSPGSKVPSHGTHAYGQAYAVDLVHRPDGTDHPEFGTVDAFSLEPERFPGFGEPLYSCADGVVVVASDRLRDHRSRSNQAALLWFMFAEGFVRELGGPGRVVGNHLIVRADDGSHFVYAHLRHRSARVAVGDRVAAGDHVADCGNTGNSTEPHLHIHRQDVASLTFATGLPWGIRGGSGDGDGFPPNEGYLDGRPAGR